MEKMCATFYVLTVLGALLVPTFAMNVTSNATNFSVTPTPEPVFPSMMLVNMTSSMNMLNESIEDATNMTTAENIPTTPMPPAEGGQTPGPDNMPMTTKKSTTIRTTKASTASNTNTQSNSVYISVLIIVICLIIGVIGIFIFCIKNSHRSFSVDIHAKHEDAHIPLAAVEPEVFDNSAKDMKTFTSAEESPPTDTAKAEEQNALTEDTQQVKESPAESQPTEAPAEKPPEPTSVDVNDGDPTASTKTSVETLNDVLNENNSNNNAVHDVNVSFIEICLND